jgi:CDP-diacylglycerol--glycerol-3-phosphate 3-phosphatidyltransferase
MKNVPNIISLFRILAILPLIYFTQKDDVISITIGLVIFAIAALSDAVDGYIARKYNVISNLGKLLDPLADKLLVLSIFIIFLTKGQLPIALVIVVLARELTITGLRSIAAAEGIVIQASVYGKIKTITQMILIIALYLANLELGINLEIICNVMIWIVGIITLLSGVDYVYKAREVFVAK